METPKTQSIRINANIDRKLQQAFKVACATEGRDMTAVLSELITGYIAITQAKQRSNTQ